MSETTSRWALPLLHAGQAQKETTHNEALMRIDMMLHASVEAIGVLAPPAEVEPGQSWIVGDGTTGAWGGRDGQLATWTEGGWRYVAPQQGMRVWSRADGVWADRIDGGWTIGIVTAGAIRIAGQQVVGARSASVPIPDGGAVIDAEARAAIAGIIDRLASHGLVESG
ncbi:DUF2793 domain-containing protein [Sphingomonas japonica]|uniref:DUF2793 domain-containing protein n=1 Tax=Sphingomonas japonica TaxID=511662 RepID=A0ABX0U0X2_9SPHN|nr:DUF2793 domain-containing protein [Sphingomonas japonica]NIJ23740.1 hypothetical protein [Sphingomonas japonica]